MHVSLFKNLRNESCERMQYQESNVIGGGLVAQCSWQRGRYALLSALNVSVISWNYIYQNYIAYTILFTTDICSEEPKKSVSFPFLLRPSILITHSYLFHFWNADVKLPARFQYTYDCAKLLAAHFLFILHADMKFCSFTLEY